MGDYEFHMSTVREWVFDSFKTVTFKYLAHHLSVSSNYAKQMLFDFAERNKGQVHLTYYLSGTSKSDQSFRITVVQESQLAEFEKKLETVVSKHLYGVSASALTDSAQLWSADREIYNTSDPMSTENWNLIHDTSAVCCSAVDKRATRMKKPAPVAAPPPSVSRAASLQSVQINPPLQKQNSAPTPSTDAKQAEAPPAPAKASNIKTPGSTPKKSIMGMFAASESKAKVAAAVAEQKAEEEKKAGVSGSSNGASSDPKHTAAKKSVAVIDTDEPTAKKTPSKVSSAKASSAKSTGQRTISFAKQDSTITAAASTKMVESEKPAEEKVDESEDVEIETDAVPVKASPVKASPIKKSPIKKSPVKSPKKSPEKAAAAKKTASSQMDVDEPAAPSVPKSLEDELMEDLEADSDEKESRGLSKLKKNVPAEDADVFDSDEDPLGENSKEAKAARAKKKEEEKQKARKEAAEARKKAREEAKAAEKAAEAELNAANGDEKKKRRRKRSTSPGPASDEEPEPPVVTEQRRRFDAYFGATPATTDAAHPNEEAVTYAPTVDVPKMRTRKVVEEEEYVNEKGYTVTRTVERTIEEEIPEEERSKLKQEAEDALKRRQVEDEARKAAEAKKAAAAAAKSSPAKVTAPAAKKASIASFFAKKS